MSLFEETVQFYWHSLLQRYAFLLRVRSWSDQLSWCHGLTCGLLNIQSTAFSSLRLSMRARTRASVAWQVAGLWQQLRLEQQGDHYRWHKVDCRTLLFFHNLSSVEQSSALLGLEMTHYIGATKKNMAVNYMAGTSSSLTARTLAEFALVSEQKNQTPYLTPVRGSLLGRRRVAANACFVRSALSRLVNTPIHHAFCSRHVRAQACRRHFARPRPSVVFL